MDGMIEISMSIIFGSNPIDWFKEKKFGNPSVSKNQASCANLFWWYNMYSSVDFSITPRPLYRSDGLKAFDIHSQPMNVRDQVKKDLGDFPFPSFWGPRAGVESSRWIADATRWIENRHQPDLNLIYLPHLDYDLQRYGPHDPKYGKALSEIDEIAGSLIDFSRREELIVSSYPSMGSRKPRKSFIPIERSAIKDGCNLRKSLVWRLWIWG